MFFKVYSIFLKILFSTYKENKKKSNSKTFQSFFLKQVF